MFREIVSQLSFSPATVERLSAYAHTIKQRQRTSSWSLLVLSLLLIIQVIITIAPPHTPQLATKNDLIPGGIISHETLLTIYDDNVNGFKDAATALSIGRSDLVSSTKHTSAPPLPYSTGLTPRATSQEQAYSLPNHILYIRDTNTHQLTQQGWLGTTTTSKTFFVLAQDGNILSSHIPTMPSIKSKLKLSHAAAQTDATNKTLTWTLRAENSSPTPVQEDISFSTADIEEYATVEIPAGAIVSDEQQLIIWPGVNINPGEHRIFTVTARLDPKINTTGRNPVNTYSYDCRISTAFGNTQEISIPCPLTKQLELLAYDLPYISNKTSIIIYSVLLVINIIVYFVLRQFTKEIRIIRTQLNTGGL